MVLCHMFCLTQVLNPAPVFSGMDYSSDLKSMYLTSNSKPESKEFVLQNILRLEFGLWLSFHLAGMQQELGSHLWKEYKEERMFVIY